MKQETAIVSLRKNNGFVDHRESSILGILLVLQHKGLSILLLSPIQAMRPWKSASLLGLASLQGPYYFLLLGSVWRGRNHFV